ncbi:MAG TPA: hypothetical protein VHV08_10915 [Pirellulales bacterium]|jgi:hypothetical protein|nr:hypothetical protein [Pirellulales bacterium]
MNKVAGSILVLAGAIAGHGVFVFLASHPQIHRYDVPDSVANMVLVAIAASVVFGFWGILHLIRKEHP